METLHVSNSSRIILLEYYEKDEVLAITFKKGGKYKYHPFSPRDWEDFKSSDSKGKYFEQNIKDSEKYTYRKVK